VPPIAAHAFGNWAGLPNFVAEMRARPQSRQLIRALYVAGIVTFAYTLFPATEPALFGGSRFW